MDARWAVPRNIHGGPAAHEAQTTYPSLTSRRSGGVFLVGNDVRNYGPALVSENPLVAWELRTEGARSLGRPAGNFRFAYPRALVDARDRLHLLWAEPAGEAVPIRGADFRDEGLTRVWTAHYEPARGWSVPRVVYALPDGWLIWNNNMVPHVHSQQSGRHAVLSVGILPRGTQQSGIVLFGFEAGDSLVASVVRTQSFVAYSGVATVGDRTFLGFLAPAPGPQGETDRNSVWIQVSDDSGATWREPVVISRSGNTPGAHDIKVVAAADGAVHVVWRQEREDRRDLLRHTLSRDGGRTWSATSDLEVPPTAIYHQFAVDACGTLHVIWEHRDLGSDSAHIDYATLRDRWSTIDHLFTSLNVNLPALHQAHDGRLLMVFSDGQSTADHTVRSERVYTELTPPTRK